MFVCCVSGVVGIHNNTSYLGDVYILDFKNHVIQHFVVWLPAYNQERTAGITEPGRWLHSTD